jgi:hypothetical protein
VTAAVLERPGSLFADVAQSAERRRDTLEDRLTAALHEARTDGSTECPVCRARATLAADGGHAHAECRGCGSRLS